MLLARRLVGGRGLDLGRLPRLGAREHVANEGQDRAERVTDLTRRDVLAVEGRRERGDRLDHRALELDAGAVREHLEDLAVRDAGDRVGLRGDEGYLALVERGDLAEGRLERCQGARERRRAVEVDGRNGTIGLLAHDDLRRRWVGVER